MTGLLLVLFAIVGGLFLPVQAGVNTRLAHYVGGPVARRWRRSPSAPSRSSSSCSSSIARARCTRATRPGGRGSVGFGLIGFPERGLSPLRIVGVALLVGGALLVRLF